MIDADIQKLGLAYTKHSIKNFPIKVNTLDLTHNVLTKEQYAAVHTLIAGNHINSLILKGVILKDNADIIKKIIDNFSNLKILALDHNTSISEISNFHIRPNEQNPRLKIFTKFYYYSLFDKGDYKELSFPYKDYIVESLVCLNRAQLPNEVTDIILLELLQISNKNTITTTNYIPELTKALNILNMCYSYDKNEDVFRPYLGDIDAAGGSDYDSDYGF